MLDKLLYSVDGGEKTLSLSIAGLTIGNLLKMPDFSVNVVYDDQAVGKFMKGMYEQIKSMATTLGVMVPETKSDFGNTVGEGLDGLTQTMMAFMQMQGVVMMNNGFFTRKYFDHVSHQKYSFSVRTNLEGLNHIMQLKSAFLPSPWTSKSATALMDSFADLLRPSAWWGNKEEKTDFGFQRVDEIFDQAKKSLTEGVLTFSGDGRASDGTNVNLFSDKMKKITEAQDKWVKDNVDNIMGITQADKDEAKKELGITKGNENFEILGAKLKVGTNNILASLDNYEAKGLKAISKILGAIAGATSVVAPLQIKVSDLVIFYDGSDVTNKLIRLPSTQTDGIYKSQHLMIDSLSVNPSDSLMSHEGSMVPLYYDIEISMSTTMTPVADIVQTSTLPSPAKPIGK